MAGNSNSGRRPDIVTHRYRQILEDSGAYKRFQKILVHTENEQNFLKALEIANDRAWGRPDQSIDMRTEDVTGRPATDTLLNTLATLRTELDSLRAGASVAETK